MRSGCLTGAPFTRPPTETAHERAPVFEALQRRHRLSPFEAAARTGGLPPRLDEAVRRVDEAKPRLWLRQAARGQRGDHCVEHRERDERPGAAEDGPAR